jgi:protein-S-isoprenylcysteine O-methyltransferase Ste14
MQRLLIFIYGLVAYALFVVVFLYAMGFVTGFVVPKSIDDGQTGSILTAVLVNVSILAAFAIQHTIMARPAFKRWWTRIIPKPAERSTFVLIASAILLVLFWQWRPHTSVVWHIDEPWLRGLLHGVSLLGFGIVLYASFLIDHFDLFGLRQVYLHLRGREYKHHPFMERSLYRVIRHPLMAGFLIAFWSTPTMTTGHLLFAGVTTAYIIFGIIIEERDLLKILGDDYRRYRRRTPALVPMLPPRSHAVTRQDNLGPAHPKPTSSEPTRM